MPVKFNNTEIRPAPLVTVSKRFNFDEQGNVISPEIIFNLNGTVVPSGSGGEISTGMDKIVTKDHELLSLFNNQGGLLELIPPGTGSYDTIQAFCQVQDFTLQEGQWVQLQPFTVTLVSNQIIGDDGPTDNLKSKSEDWSVQEQENGVYAITHTLSAVGLPNTTISGSPDTLIAARDWCHRNKYDINNNGILSPVSGDFNIGILCSDLSSTSGNYWNYSLTENVGRFANSWQLTETFIHYSGGNAREEWSATVQESSEQFNKASINIQGTIFGHASDNNEFYERFVNASGHWKSLVEPAIYGRLGEFVDSSFNVNPVPTLKNVTYNKTLGTVSYNYNYNALLSTLISGALEETLSIVDTGPNDIFAEIQVPGRSAGPIIQYMNTVSLPTRSVNIGALMGVPSGVATVANIYNNFYLQKPDTDDIINALKPNTGKYYLTQDQESWDIMSRRYQRNVNWTLKSQDVQGTPSGINNP